MRLHHSTSLLSPAIRFYDERVHLFVFCVNCNSAVHVWEMTINLTLGAGIATDMKLTLTPGESYPFCFISHLEQAAHRGIGIAFHYNDDYALVGLMLGSVLGVT